MSQQVVMGATLQCSFGAAPSTLVVLPQNRVNVENMPAATIMDHLPIVNIAPFGMCLAPSNPAVIAATSAAMGVFTPAPCVPVTTAPWVPGAPVVNIANMPLLNSTSRCMCSWGGIISIVNAGSFLNNIP